MEHSCARCGTFFSILQVSSNPIFSTIGEEHSTIIISIFPEDKAEVWSVKCLLTVKQPSGAVSIESREVMSSSRCLQNNEGRQEVWTLQCTEKQTSFSKNEAGPGHAGVSRSNTHNLHRN